MVSNHISQVGVEVCRCGVQHASTTGIAAAVCNAYRNKEYVATLCLGNRSVHDGWLAIPRW